MKARLLFQAGSSGQGSLDPPKFVFSTAKDRCRPVLCLFGFQGAHDVSTVFWRGLLWFMAVPVAWSLQHLLPILKGFLLNFFLPTLCFKGAALSFSSVKHSPKGVSVLRAGVGERNAYSGSGLVYLTESSQHVLEIFVVRKLRLGSRSEGITGTSLWRISKSYGNVQNWVRDTNLSTSLSTDQKWQSKG